MSIQNLVQGELSVIDPDDVERELCPHRAAVINDIGWHPAAAAGTIVWLLLLVAGSRFSLLI